MKRADAAVLLVRNPFDAILAEFNRNHGGGHTGHASREDFFDREVWYEKALDQAQRWRRLYVSESFEFLFRLFCMEILMLNKIHAISKIETHKVRQHYACTSCIFRRFTK